MKPVMNRRSVWTGLLLVLPVWLALYLAWRWAFAWLGGAP